MTMNAIPQGYKQDAKGRLIPVETIKPIDMARDQLVGEIVKKAQAVNKVLADFKTAVFADIGAFIELSAERYDAAWRGQGQRHPGELRRQLQGTARHSGHADFR